MKYIYELLNFMYYPLNSFLRLRRFFCKTYNNEPQHRIANLLASGTRFTCKNCTRKVFYGNYINIFIVSIENRYPKIAVAMHLTYIFDDVFI